MDANRAIPEIVVALILIFILGGGPVPAMIAIALHTAGALGKLFSEVNENVDMKPLEGLSSVGANWMQRMYLGVFPQVAPNWLSYALLRFEINVRASTIIGAVGGVIVVFSIVGLDKLKLDDPVGAISAHGTVGIWGVMAVLLSNGDATFMGQIIGLAAIFAFVFVTSLIVWFILKLVMGIRLSEEDEYVGADVSECGLEAYPEFVKKS
jgi:ABC-type phosphate/phosphonate transport system permease subunit